MYFLLIYLVCIINPRVGIQHTGGNSVMFVNTAAWLTTDQISLLHSRKVSFITKILTVTNHLF